MSWRRRRGGRRPIPDLLCHLAYDAPLLTRRERAEKLRKNKKTSSTGTARRRGAVLEELLEKYADHGIAEFEIPEALELPPISGYGNVMEISGFLKRTRKVKGGGQRAARSCMRCRVN